jgi:hypothetical protein
VGFSGLVMTAAHTATHPSSPASPEPRIDLLTALRTTLLRGRNADGGWAYTAGRKSRLEPTCWALLALAPTSGQQVDAAPLERWLVSSDGWLIDGPGLPPNSVFNAIAALTLTLVSPGSSRSTAIITRLLQFKGEVVDRRYPELRQDNNLAAWSWIQGTTSWVEPTAWCLLLLKHVQRHSPSAAQQERINIGEAFLLDRACAVGGWNYGNPNVYGTDLIPHVPTTALGLLAMQDRASNPVIARSLRRLQADALSERSHLALALSIICLRVYGVDSSALANTLRAICAERLQRNDPGENLQALALALCALTESPAAMSAFSFQDARA